MSALICSCGTSLAGYKLKKAFESLQKKYKNTQQKIDDKFERQNDEAMKKHGPKKDKLDEAIERNFKLRQQDFKQLNMSHQKRMYDMYISFGIDNWCCKQRIQTKVSPLDTHVP